MQHILLSNSPFTFLCSSSHADLACCRTIAVTTEQYQDMQSKSQIYLATD